VLRYARNELPRGGFFVMESPYEKLLNRKLTSEQTSEFSSQMLGYFQLLIEVDQQNNIDRANNE